MTGAPLVSIIVRTRNRPLGLREALESLVAQTYDDLEIIVVNDGGVSVRAVVDEVLGTSSRVWTLVEWGDNRRRERAANAGLLIARGDFIGLLDDDDILYKDHLSVLIAHFARDPASRVAYTDALQATQEPDAGAPYGYRTIARELALSWDVDPVAFRHRHWIPIHCVLFHRECLAEIGGFDEQLRRLEDWDFVLRLSWRFPMTHLKQITGEYRYRTDHPRLADPEGFGTSADHDAARARITGKDPERDAWAPAAPWQRPPARARKPDAGPASRLLARLIRLFS